MKKGKSKILKHMKRYSTSLKINAYLNYTSDTIFLTYLLGETKVS